MQPVFVDSDAALADMLARVSSDDRVAIDTEFIRERTYFPGLCLVQIAAADGIWCVDPLAELDLSPLYDLLLDPARTKILHSSRQDLEIFYYACRAVPAPVFDTQIAAALLGRPDQIAYAGLVAEMFGRELDKTPARTDWAQRPLTDQQIAYAADDVRYLDEMARRLQAELEDAGRMSWLQEEGARLTQPELYETKPDEAWRRLKGLDKLSSAELAAVAALAAWREREARTRDRPRGWILRDDVLLSLARHAPTSVSAMRALDIIPPGLLRRAGEELIEVLRSPAPVDASGNEPAARLTAAGKRLVQSLQAQLRERAAAAGVSASLVATRRDIEHAVRGAVPERLALGWRAAFFGDLARAEIAAHGKLPLYES